MKTIFLSSGQGSFVPGAGMSEYERIPVFSAAIDEISSILKEDIPSLCWGPSRVKVRNSPYLSHIALWALNYALYQSLKATGITPEFLMGHSLGEIISFCLSGALTISDACKLIAYRGMLFEENKKNNESDLVAVIGDHDQIGSFISEISVMPSIYAANFNLPTQVVFAIANKDIEIFNKFACKKGLRVVPLKIGNGCHSPYVASIQRQLETFVDSLDIDDPKVPVFSCVTSDVVIKATEVRNIIKQQILSPVHWWKTLDRVAQYLNNKFQFIDLNYSNVIKGPRSAIIVVT
ncbi:ACP S-malonyltransferase [Treponema sp. J25]|uniref:ACP S-malonyltransferase n=1 Tax=Treponema sp. J25 TaxID=2094121 RepID=UPI001044F876|nr:ACP S-malonyltransferase [Treponema sp. J25]TCW62200.1 hypothetical protein C5O22_02920 [Treponema sp. J25]